MLAWGALVWGVFLLGRECSAGRSGALAAFVVATRDPFLSQAVRAYVDIPFLALVVGAAVLEVRRPRRGAAGAGAARARGAAAAGGVAAGRRPTGVPAAGARSPAPARARQRWSPRRRSCGRRAISRSPATPLHSLTFTRDTADTLGRPKGIENVPEIMPRRLGEILRWVPLVGGHGRLLPRAALRPRARAGAGGARGARRDRLRRDRDRRPVAARPLPVPAGRDDRDLLRLRGARLAGSAAATGCGAGGSAGAAVLLVAFVGSTISHQTDRLDRLRDGIQLRGGIQDDLRDLTRAMPRGPLLESCAPGVRAQPPAGADPRLVPRPPAGRLRLGAARAAAPRALRRAGNTDEVRRSSCSTRATRSASRSRASRPASGRSRPTSRGCSTSGGCEINGPCTRLRDRFPGVSVALWLRPGCSAAHGEDRLRLLPSGSDLVHGTPSRGTWPSTPRAAYWP